MKRLSKALKAKSGMTLVEVLTALTLLTIMIFCFAPLFLSYLNSINASGNKLKETYHKSGLMQTLMGNKGTGSNSGYESNVASIPLSFFSPEATITRGDKTQLVNAVTIEVGTSYEDGKLDPISGSFIYTDPNPEDIKNGFSTIYVNSLNSTIKCFPTSLTDDFVKAYITVVADGFNFVDNNMKGNSYQLFCTVADASGTTKLQKLTYGKDYNLERISGTQNLLLLTLYGGTDICFENSPLVFDYNNGQYTKKIEVDAPQMIMVGEQSSDGKYYYYVSRGETDDEGNLIVLRREMKSNIGGSTLNSAMNDVEWVPAESGDGENKDAEGNKYGYYVMCGDNGQVRRFWKNNVTGNYYWGGDYTYYTDINFNTITPNMWFRGTKTYSNNVSYKYVTRRDNTQTSEHWKNGFNLSNFTGTDNSLLCANVWSVTGFGGKDTDATYFYASDGKIQYYMTQNTRKDAPLYTNLMNAIQNNGGEVSVTGFCKVNDAHRWNNTLTIPGVGTESYTWLKAQPEQVDAYYTLTGQDKATTIPITLTSVDAINLTGYGSGYYYGPQNYSHEMPHASCDVDYPKASYTLYCGYIPAAMDAWSKTTDFKWDHFWNGSGGFNDEFAQGINSASKMVRADGMDSLSEAMIGTDDSGRNNGNRFIKWKGNFGVTPYLTKPESILTHEWSLDVSEAGRVAEIKDHSNSWNFEKENATFYPYTNLNYAITGKLFDSHTDITGLFKENTSLLYGKRYKVLASLAENRVYNRQANRQDYLTNGKVVDITLGYLSHPLATHIAANPTDGQKKVYDLSNDKGNKIFYWNNSRETVTFLDSASTVIPNGDQDIPVSLMVGYVMGGMAEYWGGNIYVNTVMNNGIVYLRAGSAEIGTQKGDNTATGEYYALDKDGYKLNAESNVFHQFYYVNSRTAASDGKEPYGGDAFTKAHIGDMYGAHFWQNNQHINYVSMNGGAPDSPDQKNDNGNYNYLRSHPLTNTKVTCVAWGHTWNNNPEAMWGTENGTVLSWWVDLKKVVKSGEDSKNWNDRSVSAEFQSYKWVDNVNGKKFASKTGSYANTIGANGNWFSLGSSAYEGFYDKCSRSLGQYGTFGMISVLETINDIAYDNDVWIAVGNQSGKNPADYCPGGSATYNGTTVEAYTGNGRGGSWVNVRYWIDYTGDGVQGDNNNKYAWKSVQISDKDYCNIVQINNMNGIWYATGYIDENKNGEFDNGEKSVVCWSSDPLQPYGTENGWTDATTFLAYQNGAYVDVSDEVGGINSVATRT